MAYQIPYESATYQPEDALIPGNSEADNPVVFEVVPAEGQDFARLKSVVFASAGLVAETWSEDMQSAVIAAFGTGAAVFERVVTSVQGLSVPAAMALRVGLITEIPTRADANGTIKPDPKAPVPIRSGREFSKVCGFMTAVAMGVAFKVLGISREVHGSDPRFFGPRSGSRSPETPIGTTGPARTARKRSGKRGTAARSGKTASPVPGSSSPSQ